MSEVCHLSRKDFSKHLLGVESYFKAYNYVKNLPSDEAWLEDAGDFARLDYRADWINFNLSPVGDSGEYFSPEVFVSPSQMKIISPLVRAIQFVEGIIITGASVVLRNENGIGQDGLFATVYISEKYNAGNSLYAKSGLDLWYYPQESRWVIQTHDGEFEARGDENQEIIDLLIENLQSIQEIL